MARIARVGEQDLDDLLPLMLAYCRFYGVTARDDRLLAMARALIADPQREGLQLIAREVDDTAVGFATIFWSWSTLSAARVGVMNDLYLAPEARGQGLADELIAECLECCRERGDVATLGWQTAKDNARAQAVYVRVGAKRSEWVDYTLAV